MLKISKKVNPVHVHTSTRMHTRMHEHMHAHPLMHGHTHARMHAHTHTAHMHAHTQHTHSMHTARMHAHTCVCSFFRISFLAKMTPSALPVTMMERLWSLASQISMWQLVLLITSRTIWACVDSPPKGLCRSRLLSSMGTWNTLFRDEGE